MENQSTIALIIQTRSLSHVPTHVTYVTMSRTCRTCSKKAAEERRQIPKMHLAYALLTKTLRKISLKAGADLAHCTIELLLLCTVD